MYNYLTEDCLYYFKRYIDDQYIEAVHELDGSENFIDSMPYEAINNVAHGFFDSVGINFDVVSFKEGNETFYGCEFNFSGDIHGKHRLRSSALQEGIELSNGIFNSDKKCLTE